jgi:uncharacterized protein
MTTFRHIPLLTALALPLAAIALDAQTMNPTAEQLQFIRVTGEAVIGSAPDEVMIDLGVTTQARTAQAAASENAQKVERVMAVLKKEAGEGATTRTTQYALNPDYRQVREENEPPLISSYTAYNMVQVRTKDLARIGRIIDAAIAAGANTIQSVSFSINEQNKARNQALTEATANAMTKAEAIAAGLKMRVKRILSVDEGGSMMPMYRGGYAGGRDMMQSSTIVDPGAVDVRGMVTLMVEIGS